MRTASSKLTALGLAALPLCLAAYGSAGCSSSDPGSNLAGAGGATAGIGGEVAVAGGGMASGGNATAGMAGSLAGGGQTSAAGTGGTAGAPSRADAVSAIKAGCQTAVQACPKVTVDQCESSNESQLQPETAPCFGSQVSVLECVGRLPVAAFQCVANFAQPTASYCMDENSALQTCYAAHAAM
jgi:hypothetical protein